MRPGMGTEKETVAEWEWDWEWDWDGMTVRRRPQAVETVRPERRVNAPFTLPGHSRDRG